MISVPKHVYVVGLMNENKYDHDTYKRNIEARSRNHCCHVKELLRVLGVCL
jgi:translation initiation factor IF-3